MTNLFFFYIVSRFNKETYHGNRSGKCQKLTKQRTNKGRGLVPHDRRLQNAVYNLLGEAFPKRGFLTGWSFARPPESPNSTCWKPNLYDLNFPNQPWWNEFERAQKSDIEEILVYRKNPCAKALDTIHEIHNPCANNERSPEPVKRWVFGNFGNSGFSGLKNRKYIFLGLYELDVSQSLPNGVTKTYQVDASFPKWRLAAEMQAAGCNPSDIANIQNGTINFLHWVYKRVKTDWQDGNLLWTPTTDNSQEEG